MSIDQPVTYLRLQQWDRDADHHDLRMLAHCVAPTLDVGCGPGRLTAALAGRGEVVLGIDVSASAVTATRDRGGPALQRDVFDELPWEGRWRTALLADGNVGIGGDPASLLGRLGELLGEGGRVVVELAPPGTPHTDDWAVLEDGDGTEVIRWSVVGADAIDLLAQEAGFAVAERIESGARWWAVLVKEELAA